MSEHNKMGKEWDERAERNAFHYVLSAMQKWETEDFFKTGEVLAQRITDPCIKERLGTSTDKTALDIGCGVGRVTRSLCKRFKYVIGVDVSGKMIEIAKSLHDTQKYNNIEFLQNNGRAFSFLRDNSVDYIFSVITFQHMPSKEVIEANVEDLSRVLKEEGVCQIQFSVPEGRAKILRIVPFPRKVIPFIPSQLLNLYAQCTETDPLKKSESYVVTWLTKREIQSLFGKHGLYVTLQKDYSHQHGTWIWALGKKKTSEVTSNC